MLRVFAAAIAIGLASPAFAGDAPDWRAVDETTGQIRDVEGLEQLARDFPDSGTVRLRMLQPLLAAGEVERVMETLEWLYDRGYVFSDFAQEQIPKLLEGVDPGRIAERLRAEAEVIEASEVVATVPAEAGLVESVTRDPKSGLIVSPSYETGKIWRVSADQTTKTSSSGAGVKVSGVAYDHARQQIWASLPFLPNPFAPDVLLTALTTLCLEAPCSGMVTVATREAKSLNDLHVAPDGRLFASDSIGGGIYWRQEDGGKLLQLVAPGTFRSPQGLATSEDNTKLYVSDYRYGIAIIDLETREVARLASDIPVILDGVDGLWRYGNELIAVQNGTSPMRISAFQLSEDGTRVVGHRVLEQAHGEWTEPLSGSIDGDALIYVGNGQWDRYIEGELKEGMEALPTEIRRLPLSQPTE